MLIKIFTNAPHLEIDKIYKKDENEFIIATDRIVFDLIKHNIKVDVAIGDFDSLKENELLNNLEEIKILKFDKDKDDTDTVLALKHAKKMDYRGIIIYTNSDGRIDHFYSMINLLDVNTKIITQNNEISFIKPGTYSIQNEYKYISFFAVENVENLSLKGFKYPLVNHNLKQFNNLCVSNELSGEVSFKKGKLLIFKSNQE